MDQFGPTARSDRAAYIRLPTCHALRALASRSAIGPPHRRRFECGSAPDAWARRRGLVWHVVAGISSWSLRSLALGGDGRLSWQRMLKQISDAVAPPTVAGASQYDAFISYSHGVERALAATLQTALQRFAKPWNRRSALRMFRDETNLSASPGLS